MMLFIGEIFLTCNVSFLHLHSISSASHWALARMYLKIFKGFGRWDILQRLTQKCPALHSSSRLSMSSSRALCLLDSVITVSGCVICHNVISGLWSVISTRVVQSHNGAVSNSRLPRLGISPQRSQSKYKRSVNESDLGLLLDCLPCFSLLCVVFSSFVDSVPTHTRIISSGVLWPSAEHILVDGLVFEVNGAIETGKQLCSSRSII